MSRETLLDEAIVKAKEAEDWQLVEWLRMARGGESAARWYTARLRGLEDENARLRSCLSDDAENARMIMRENAKLRELVRVMAYCMQQERDCDGCAMNDAAGVVTERAGCNGLRDRMRELCVEVEG